jgi:hypothetical protein
MSKADFLKAHIEADHYFENIDFSERMKLVLEFKENFPELKASVINLVAYIAAEKILEVA